MLYIVDVISQKISVALRIKRASESLYDLSVWRAVIAGGSVLSF
jgi:hypothetical protein